MQETRYGEIRFAPRRQSRRRQFGELARTLWIAPAPLLVSLAFLLAGIYTEWASAMSIVVLFLTSILLILGYLRAQRGLERLATIVVIGGFVFWYSYPALFQPILGDEYDFGVSLPFDAQTILLSVVCLSLFLLAMVVTAALLSKEIVPGAATGALHYLVSPNRLTVILILAVGIGLLPYLILGGGVQEIVSGILGSRAVEKDWMTTSNLGDSTSPFLFLAGSILVGAVCLLWVMVLDNRLSLVRRGITALGATLITLMLVVDQGTRSTLALIVMPALGIGIMRLWRRSKLWTLIAIAVAVVVLFFVVQFQLVYRLESTRERLGNLLFLNWMTLGGTIDYFKETVIALQIAPRYHDFFHESILLQFLVSPIPRFLWPSKPLPELIWFYTYWRWGIDIYETGGNVFPGIAGQFYMSWGWIGPAMGGALVGLVAALINNSMPTLKRFRDPYALAMAMMVLTWVILSYRNLSPGFLYPVLFAGLFVILARQGAERGRSRTPLHFGNHDQQK